MIRKITLPFYKIKVSNDVIGLVYILIASLLSNLLPIPEIIKSIFALPSFFIVPYLFGAAIITIIRRIPINFDAICRFTISWLCGIVLMFLLAFMLDLLGLFYITLYSAAIIAIIIVTNLTVSMKNLRKRARASSSVPSNPIHRIVMSAFIGLIPAVYYLTFLPFPQQYHNVLPNLNREVLEILANAPYGYHKFVSTYTITPYLLLALPSFLFNIRPHTFFWAAPLIFYPLFSIGLNVFSYKLSKNTLVSMLASFIGVWTMTYTGGFQENYSVTPRAFLYLLFPFALYIVQSVRACAKVKFRDIAISLFMIIICFLPYFLFSSLFFNRLLVPPFAPKNWQIIVIFPLLFFLVFRKVLQGKDALPIFQYLFLIAITFIILHSFEALAYVFTIFLYVIFYALFKDFEKSIFLAYLLIVFNYSLFLMQYQGNLHIPEFKLTSYFLGQFLGQTYSGWWGYKGFHTLYNVFINANTFLMSIIFLIGTIIIAFTNSDNLAIAATSSTIFLIYFLPDPFVYRIGASLAPFMMYTIAFLLVKILPDLIARIFSKIKIRIRLFELKIENAISKKNVSLLFFILISILITPAIIQPIQHYHHASYVTDFEYEAADFIWKTMSRETQKNTFVISDVRSTVIISGLTYIESPISRFMNEEAYSNEAIKIINYIKDYVFMANDTRNAWNSIEKLRQAKFSEIDCYDIGSKSKIIVVITGRTLKWLTWLDRNRFYFYESDNISTYKQQRVLDNFLNENYFKLLYKIEDKIYIFEQVKDTQY